MISLSSLGTLVALVRHGPTEWNAQKRVQGWTDIPLSASGRAVVAGWRLPIQCAGWRLVTSPLVRAHETARMLAAQSFDHPVEPIVRDALKEMRWGDFEGHHLDDLRARFGDVMAAWEAQGWDFRAPDGESPRDLLARITPVLAEIGDSGANTVAVCHRGVMRAALASAIGWDMTGKPPIKIQDGRFLLFAVDQRGALRLVADNIALTAEGLTERLSTGSAPAPHRRRTGDI